MKQANHLLRCVLGGFLISLVYHLTIVPALFSAFPLEANGIFPPNYVSVIAGAFIAGPLHISYNTECLAESNIACLTEEARQVAVRCSKGNLSEFQACKTADPAYKPCADALSRANACKAMPYPVWQIVMFGSNFVIFGIIASWCLNLLYRPSLKSSR